MIWNLVKGALDVNGAIMLLCVWFGDEWVISVFTREMSIGCECGWTSSIS